MDDDNMLAVEERMPSRARDLEGLNMNSPTDHRTIDFFNVSSDTGNKIRTNKYTWYTFLPKNLWEQFHNLANVYFLIMMLLQGIPQISITYGKPTLILPLSIVIFVQAVKDLAEDLAKGRADREENDRKVIRISTPSEGSKEKEMPIPWEDVQPGHILKVERNQRIPCDLLLLESSDWGRSCQVNTMNLDGETNLKQKDCALPEDRHWNQLSGAAFDFEEPSSDLYQFRAAIKLTKESAPHGISINSLLLRGSALKKTEHAIGMAVYCGHDSRIMKNASEARFKRSTLDEDMNSMVVIVFILEISLCILAGLLYVWWEVSFGTTEWYLMIGQEHRSPFQRFLVKAGTWVLQMCNMVPISMMVQLTTVKFFQGWFLQHDEAMKDVERDRYAEVHCSQVLESLGQITHVFSDKTGTLTCNEMRYKACSVNGKIYGLHEMDKAIPGAVMNASVDFSDAERFKLDMAANNDGNFLMANFLLCHAVCHTVAIEDPKEAIPEYVASSPDELALVSFCREMGMELSGLEKTSTHVKVTEPRLEDVVKGACGNKDKRFQVKVLDLCEFDNDRKCMSVVVEYPNGKKALLIKGADTAILPYIKRPSDKEQLEQLERHLQRFAQTGLRTLCLGYREISDDEFNSWHRKYQTALATLEEDRAAKVQDMANELERADGLQLLGATAIDDRLQDGVSSVIESLRLAQITVWVLTGDKMETAINIGKSCNLLTDLMNNIEIQSELDVKAILASDLTFSEAETHPDGLSLTITGHALGIVLADQQLRRKFYRLAHKCKSVLCCRVSPKQKSMAVELAKEFHFEFAGEQPVTLCIGDGANDVAMINTAHVGVGLTGKEGAQAARAADFAFSEFRHLERLLFFHGHENYRRNAVLVCYNFYKNMLCCLPPFVYGFFMSFSGQPFYEQILFQFYNVVYTWMPVILFALFDRAPTNLKDRDEASKAFIPGRHRRHFNYRVFGLWMLTGALQAVLLTLLAFSTLGDGSVVGGQTSGDLWTMGAVLYFWVIVCANATIFQRMNVMFNFSIATFVISILIHPLELFIVDRVAGSNFLRGTFSFMYGAGFGRLAALTGMAVSAHLCLGEPILSLTSPDMGTRADCHHSYSQLQNELTTSTPSTCPEQARRLMKRVDTYKGSAYDAECTVQLNEARTRGCRSSTKRFGSRQGEIFSSSQSLEIAPAPTVPLNWTDPGRRRSVSLGRGNRPGSPE